MTSDSFWRDATHVSHVDRKTKASGPGGFPAAAPAERGGAASAARAAGRDVEVTGPLLGL